MTADDEKKTKKLLTPFGEIKILIDGKPIIPWHVFLKPVYPMNERRKVVIGWNAKAFIMIAGLKCPSVLNVSQDT